MDSELHVDANTCPDTSTDTDNESSFGNSGLDSADLDSDNADSDSESIAESDCDIEITGFSHDLHYDDAVLHGEPVFDSDLDGLNTESEDFPDKLSEFLDLPDFDLNSDINAEFFATPKALDDLREQLLDGYKPPDECPPDIKTGKELDTLTRDARISLEHFVAWKKSNGTVKAYEMHAKVLASHTGAIILTLYQAKKLAVKLTGFYATKIDMCSKSCIAYTGKYETLDKCPYKPVSGPICGSPRYRTSCKGDKKPVAQCQMLPIMDTVRALFANAETSSEMRNRDSCLQQVLHLAATAAKNPHLMNEAASGSDAKSASSPSPVRQYSDYGDGQVHLMQYEHLGLFKDPRDVAFALSTDGAQLTMKKQSNTWLLIFIILNLPVVIRYGDNVVVNLATPGPFSPGDIESFLWFVFTEMAKASAGIWMYDAVDSSYFLNHAAISMALGDMLGSQKINGMAGHMAIFGDRFSLVQAARSSCAKGSKALYYPSNPPENSKYNPERPGHYNLHKLPLRTQSQYWRIIQELEDAQNAKERAGIVKATGISRLPLCAASLAFIHPTFFPIDPFHSFYENILLFIWDSWTVHSTVNEQVHFHNVAEFGRLLSEAIKTLPPVFCGPIRDPHLKRQSQYKIYEWMALLHWYIIPIGIETGMDPSVLKNFSMLVEIIEFAMTNAKRTDEDLSTLQELIIEFLTGFEKLYVGDNPEKIHRMRLCIFQLIHVPNHIRWNGSIRLGSQATVERSIGEMGRKIRSKKAPFANLTNLIYEKELIKILCLYYPELDINHKPKSDLVADLRPIQQHRINKKHNHMTPIVEKELAAISRLIKQTIKIEGDIQYQRWGKLKLLNGHVLSSRSTEAKNQTQRQSFWFEVCIICLFYLGDMTYFDWHYRQNIPRHLFQYLVKPFPIIRSTSVSLGLRLAYLPFTNPLM